MKLIDRVPAAELVQRLQAVTLNGIDFLGAAALGDNDRALGRVVAEAEFAARLPAGADAEVGAALARFADAAGTPLRIERHSDKGIGRVVDVRKSLRSIELFEDDRVRARLDWPDGALVRFRVAVSHEGSARPSEVLAALFAADVAPRAELADIASRAELARRACGVRRRSAPRSIHSTSRVCAAIPRPPPSSPPRRTGDDRGCAAGRLRAVIETVGLTKLYGEKRAVDRLTLRIEPGEVMGFLGPNGSGKTTTIRLLMGLLRPTEGSASIRGRDCHRDAVALKREVGYLPDEPFLYPYLSGHESLELVAGLHGFSAREARARARASAETFGLGDAAGTFTVTYSHGMKKRLALAMALIHEPQVLILDEPTNGLDPKGAREMRDIIVRLAAGGRTVFLSTHLLEAAERIRHRVTIIRNRRAAGGGHAERLRARSCRRARHQPGGLDLFLRTWTETVACQADRRRAPARSRPGAWRA